MRVLVVCALIPSGLGCTDDRDGENSGNDNDSDNGSAADEHSTGPDTTATTTTTTTTTGDSGSTTTLGTSSGTSTGGPTTSSSTDEGTGELSGDDTGDSAGRVVEVFAGKHHSCARWSSRAVKCWGANMHGQLGQGHSSAVGTAPEHMGAALPWLDIGTGLRPAKLSVNEHICAVDQQRHAKCWGLNDTGQLGHGNRDDRGAVPGQMGDALPYTALGGGSGLPIAEVVAIDAGDNHSCAALADGRVKCWGKNERGQLGLGHVDYWGDDRNEMGDFLAAVDLGIDPAQDPAVDVATGARHSCALTRSGVLKCWGYNRLGQLGVEHTRDVGGKAEDVGANMARVPFTRHRTPLAVVAGDQHTCVTFDDDSIVCFGDNSYGQLGQGHERPIGAQTGDISAGIAPIKLGSSSGVAQLEAAGNRSCARLHDGNVKCFGDNRQGSLGVGHEEHIGTAPEHMDQNLESVDLGGSGLAVHLAMGTHHTCAVLEEGFVKCWGSNLFGQLGQGDDEAVGDQPGELGEALPAIILE